MARIAYAAGHALITPGKRSPADEREWYFNDIVATAFAERLNQYENVQLLRLDDPTGKRDVPLHERTNKANEWQADVLIDFHHNALAGRWHNGGGVETFTHPKSSKKSKDLQKLIHPAIVKAMGLTDRGMKESNFHMLRESNMAAVLVEGGFMDSTKDIKAMRDEKRLKAQGEATADAVAKFFNLKLKAVKVAQKEETKVDLYKKDAAPSKSLAEEFNAAVKAGITDGTYPQRPATREEVAVMIYRGTQLQK